MMTPDDIFQLKAQLQSTIEEKEQALQALRVSQDTMTKPEELAKSVLQYNDLQNEIDDRAQIFSLLSGPLDNLRSPYVKAELFRYFEAAETIGPALVNALADIYIEEVRQAAASGEFDAVDLIQAEFKEYILPAKIIGEQFTELEGLLGEMQRYCKGIDPAYAAEQDVDVLRYAFQKAIDADTRLEPTVQAIKTFPMQLLQQDMRKALLDRVEERLAIIRFETAKNENIAMDTAINMLASREPEA